MSLGGLDGFACPICTVFQMNLGGQFSGVRRRPHFYSVEITSKDHNIKIIGSLLFNNRIHSPNSPCHRLGACQKI